MRASELMKGAWILGVLLVVTAGMIRGLRSSPPEAPASKAEAGEPPPGGAPETLSPTAAPTPTAPLSGGDALKEAPCELAVLVEEFRKGRHSPAYRRYVREQLRRLAGTLPAEQLWSQLLAERAPEVLDLLAEAWVTRYTLEQDASILERLVNHLASERDPALRATLVRALRHTGEPSTELLGRSVLKGRDVYAAWVKDEAPEVRQAVVENVREEAARNFGRFQGVAEKAVALAVEATDPKVKAALLTASSLEAARPPAVARVRELLQGSEHPEVRAAAAKALGTVVSVAQAQANMKVLAERYAAEGNRQVRLALLESIARLGLGKAVPVLQRLREVDASLQGEVDRWLALLASRPQTWSLLEKDRRAAETRAP